jgi:hypothetical protein
MNSPLNFPAPAPLQACCLPLAAGARPESFDPAPDLNEAMAAFVQASGVLARSLVAFALAPAKWRRVASAGVNLQNLPGDAMRINPHAPLLLAKSSCATLVCDEGTLWITQGDGHDYLLTPGQSLALAPRDKVIVKAMHGAAQVRCVGA